MRSRERAYPVQYLRTLADSRRIIKAAEAARRAVAVVSSESMQHQNFTEVLRALTVMFDRLPRHQRQRAEDVILRIISALGEHVLAYGCLHALRLVIVRLLQSVGARNARRRSSDEGVLAVKLRL